MCIGIAGGLIMAGLIAGAITGSITVLLIAALAGFGIAGLNQLHQIAGERRKVRSKLASYPSYKY